MNTIEESLRNYREKMQYYEKKLVEKDITNLKVIQRNRQLTKQVESLNKYISELEETVLNLSHENQT